MALELLLVIFLCSFTVLGQAATWYVRPVAPLGTYGREDGTSYVNAFNGLTEAERTGEGLAWGARGVKAGDTLYICGIHWLQVSQASQSFTYGRIAIPVQGLSDSARITIRCDAPEERGVMWGYGRNTSLSDQWTGPDANGVYRINRDLGDFIAQDITKTGVVYLNQKTTTTWTGDRGAFCRSGGATYVKTTDGGSPAGRLYTGNVTYRFALLRNQYITFKNCTFYGFLMDVDRDEDGEEITTLPRSNHITFEGCVMRYGNARDMFRLYDGNNYWRFENCTMEYASQAICSYGTFGGDGASYMTIRGCTFKHMGVLMFPHQDAHAIGIRRGHDNLIEQNTLEDTGSAIEFWTSVGNPMRNMTVRYNFIKNVKVKERTEGSGIVISGDNPPLGTPILGERTGFVFYGNIIMDAEGCGISSNNQDPVMVLNNIAYNCNIGFRFEVDNGGSVRATVKNNIIARPRQYFLIVAGVANELNWDYNMYSAPSGTSSLWKPWYSFAAWRQGAGVDSHSKEGNPRFVSSTPASPQDFKLWSDSWAIDAGANVGLTCDFDGGPVPIRQPDIGVFEKSAQNSFVSQWQNYQ